MENAIGIQASPTTRNEVRLVRRNDRSKAEKLKRLSILEWYQVLRAHHHWTIFQAIRFALWLAR